MEKTLKKIQKKIHSRISPQIEVTVENNCIVLRGELDDWDQIVSAGHLAVNKKFYGVINDIKLKGFKPSIKAPNIKDKLYDGLKPDVLVVGAGIVGCATARELARYKLDVMVLDKDYDVAMAASSRNDGDIHVGIDLMPNMKKFQYNVRGNAMYDKLSEELDADFHRTGHIILFRKKWERYFIYPLIKLKARFLKIPGVKYMKREDLIKIETGLPSWASGGAFMPTGGEISPYKFTVAFAENAAQNGVKFCFNTIVEDMTVQDGEIKAVQTNRGTIYPRVVINCAGVFADVIAEMAGDRTFTIHPRKGTNLILDKKCRSYAATSMNKSPFTKLDGDKEIGKRGKHTKGGGVVHTVDGNVLVGPTAVETPYREDNTTDKESIDAIMKNMSRVAEKMTYGDIITYFSGTRAPTYEEDFVIRKGIFTKNIVQAAGIQSPGLTAAPAIAEDVAKWAAEIIGDVQPNKSFNSIRKAPPRLVDMSLEERNKLIQKNPDYGEIICRCEEVSKGEILDALNSPIPVYSLDAIKRRVRPGMGRCQGGFCSPLVMKILAEHKGVGIEDIPKANEMSFVLYGDTKGDSKDE
ncbi:MAG: NAD(P)/FAD-dependent oxidoreductase [Bacillota bacterium]|jgi:glycerol-3-phosphate dehydrogenase|nr:NAD(P)/FAD-dependent oxidoreductase [Bacillota bacterium]HHU43146.1 NAD(P)/FAD-dependent oxidoreductase [Clostridiales bacterium]